MWTPAASSNFPGVSIPSVEMSWFRQQWGAEKTRRSRDPRLKSSERAASDFLSTIIRWHLHQAPRICCSPIHSVDTPPRPGKSRWEEIYCGSFLTDNGGGFKEQFSRGCIPENTSMFGAQQEVQTNFCVGDNPACQTMLSPEKQREMVSARLKTTPAVEEVVDSGCIFPPSILSHPPVVDKQGFNN